MEVRVNIINEMKKIRESTYADKYTWIDEVVQNAQRAKATHIKINVDYNKVVISDNGVGCTDPQVLFDKSTSGWDEETTKNESPFGEGFFSTIIAANTIKVESVGFTAIFDVEKMFKENTVNVIDVTPNRKKSGFTLTLTDLRDNIYPFEIESRVKETTKYIKTPSTTLNGERIKYEGLSPDNEKPFIRKINNKYCQGWIRPYEWLVNGDFGRPIIKIFSHSRLVKNTEEMIGVTGVLNLKDNMVTLRSPDRKDFIRDEKYENFINMLTNEIQKMYTKVLKTGTDMDIKNYASNIERYVDLDEYKKHIKFKIMNNINETNIDNSDNTNNTNNIDDINNTGNNDIDDINNTDDNDTNENDIREETITNTDDFTVETNVCNNSIAANFEENTQTGNELNKISYGFYVEQDDIEQYREIIEIAEYYNIPVIEIRNLLEKNILKDNENFHQISEMPAMVTLKGEYKNMSPRNEQEIRAMKLLSKITKIVNEKIIKTRDDLFAIGDIKMQRILNMGDKEHIIEKDIKTFAVAYNNKIYIDRNMSTAYDGLTDKSPDLTYADIRFIMLNLETIAHELAHACFKTTDNSKAHAEAIIKIMDVIIKNIYK